MKIVLALISIICILPLSGCYDYKETDNMAIVSGIAVSCGDGGEAYKITAEVANIQSDSKSSPEPKLIEQRGESLAEAVNMATAVSGKQMYFGHTQVLIIDYELAKRGIKPVLDYFSRQNDMRLSMDVLVAKNAKPFEILGKGEDNSVCAFVISNMINTNKKRAVSPNIELYSFISQNFEEGESYIPIISLTEKKDIKIEGLAVFKNSRLVGEMSGENTKFLMFLADIGNKGGMILERDENDERGNISFETRNRVCRIDPVSDGKNLTVNVDFKGKYGISELMGEQSLLKENAIEDLEEELSQYMKKRLEGALLNMRDNAKCDLLKIERKLLQKNSNNREDIINNFPEMYKNAQFNVKVTSKIVESGRTSRQLVRLR